MRLRLYHHGDGARVAYRETGTGPAIVLLHSLGLSHREWEPIVEPLSARFRVVLPDLPLHGDSEDRPRHPYTPEWLTEVVSSLLRGGRRAPRDRRRTRSRRRARAAGRRSTAELAPAKLVLMGTRLHRRRRVARSSAATWRFACEFAVVPGLDRLLSHAAGLVFRPSTGMSLTAQGNPAARDLVRHAFSDVGGNANRARSWARFVHRWPAEAQRDLLDAYARITLPVLLLWAEEDPFHPLDGAP